MDESTIIVALTLVALFMSAIIWIEIHTRKSALKGLTNTKSKKETKNEHRAASDDPATRNVI